MALLRKLRHERTITIGSSVFGLVLILALGLLVGSFSPTEKNLTLSTEITSVAIPIAILLFFWGMSAHQDIKMLILTDDTVAHDANIPAEQAEDT